MSEVEERVPLEHTDGLEKLRELRGAVAVVCTTGSIQEETHKHLSNLRSWNDRSGFVNIEYMTQPAVLVEAGRDAVCQHALTHKYDFLLQIDGDAAPFPQHALARMLQIVYITQPWIDVLGAYSQLKSPPYVPTIDTGTGTWQPEPCGQGVLPVIRTGGHFFLTKCDVLKRFGPPWFRTRQPASPLRAMRDVDNFARTRFDGANPLSNTSEWDELFEVAAEDPDARKEESRNHVGEDSGFCDAVRAHGGQIAVDTDLVVGHVSKKVVLPKDMIEHMRGQEQRMFAAVGVENYW